MGERRTRKITTYIYDEYNRVTNVTRPLNGVTNYTYNPTNGSGSSYTHTTNSPDKVSVRTASNTYLDT